MVGLGLDPQGGMHVVLEVSPSEIIRGLSNDGQDPDLIAALQKARIQAKGTQTLFVDLFYAALAKLTWSQPATAFSSAANKDRASFVRFRYRCTQVPPGRN